MNKHELLFSLDTENKMIIPLQDPVKRLGPTYEEDILLLHDESSFLLSEGTVYYNLEKLANLLKKALKNQLQLHKSIIFDIGFLYNKYLYNKNGFVMHIFPSGVSSWIGLQYHLWEGTSNHHELISWIYNDSSGNIIFEISPFYPYMYCEPKEESNYISYDEWIKTYKPFLIRTIPVKTACEWLKKAKFVTKTIEDNEAQWQKEKQSNKN